MLRRVRGFPPGFLVLLLLVTACAVAPGPAAAVDPVEEPLAVGMKLAPLSLRTLGGAEVAVPDPSGGYVVLELIRSADW